jgi:hypothetical protein
MFTPLSQLLSLFDTAGKKYLLIGNETAGVVAGLDLEGRLFAVLGGRVLNRVNPGAILGQSTRDGYLNPGGDGLWPAPEGTAFGYQYSTGKWRVPPGLTSARYRVAHSAARHAVIRAEVDLVNNAGTGVPALFERAVSVDADAAAMTVTVEERIEYLGTRALSRGECLLAPWTLCQFDCGPGCAVVFPEVDSSAIRYLYEPSGAQRARERGLWRTRTDGSQRYQIGLDSRVDWIEFDDPGRGLRVRRDAAAPARGQTYVDIADAPPNAMPSDKGVRYSVYSDPSRFMEIEAAGGCPETLAPGTVLSLVVTTRYTLTE